MELVCLDVPDLAKVAADAIESLVLRRPDAVLGLATGSSPLPIYAELIRRHRAGTAPSYDGVTWFTLDEYVGLPAGHEQSYRATIRRELTDALGVAEERLHTPDASPDGLRDAGERYEELILAAGGIDLQILGIGANGHLAFNEQGSSLASRTRLKTLTQQTRLDNARFFDALDEVPVHCLTQGVGTIREARHLVLIASGGAKAAAVAAAVEGPITASCPASVLQLHPHATVLVDEAAAGSLERLAYYRDTWTNRPAWQPL